MALQYRRPGHQLRPIHLPRSMSIAAVKSRPPVNLNADDSYDRYKRPRWQPVLLLVATSVLMLALKLDVYNPRSLMLFLIPSTMLSLDQRVNKIMSLTPLIGVSSPPLWRAQLTASYLCSRTRRPCRASSLSLWQPDLRLPIRIKARKWRYARALRPTTAKIRQSGRAILELVGESC